MIGSWGRGLRWLSGLAVALACNAGCSRSVDVTLDLEPRLASDCHTPVATTVRWDASGAGIKAVRLEVHNLGGRSKLWAISGGRGELTAGAWAHDGYTVTLKDMHGVELARRTLVTTPCPRKPRL